MRGWVWLGAVALAATAACYDAPIAETRVVVNTSSTASATTMSSGESAHEEVAGEHHHHHEDDARLVALESQLPRGAADHVLILQSSHLNRPAAVLGIVDVHLDVANQDQALSALRRRAAVMGADAVVGVEYHHGEVESGPIHLSGLAVRFVDMVGYPHD